ncbi:Protein SHQ1-like protein, partial [Ophiophagus hannah]
MITPVFELSQDPDFLTIIIKVPYARVSEFDIYFEGNSFRFYAKPYFLRLTLPGRVVEDGREKASYDDSGAPDEENIEEEEEFDWEIEQTLQKDHMEDSLCPSGSYGFGSQKSGVFRRLQDELNEVIDVKNPDITPASERREKRLAAEAAKFDPDHYLADFFEEEAIHRLLNYKPWWVNAYELMINAQESTSWSKYNQSSLEDEKEQLRKFTNRTFLLDKRASQQVYLSLIDILLAYCYEVCATEGENNVESPWNIRKLSSTLCWLETFTSISEVLTSFGRRVLCYPLYRHFGLVIRALNDTIMILKLGKSAVLKCLLDIHKIFRENDPAYILNDLYITDYCIWIQKAKSKKLAALAECMQKAELSKEDLGLELNELETAALLVHEEEKELKAIDADDSEQQLPPPSQEETSEFEDSGSTSSYETEVSDSDEQESSASEDGKINPSQCTLLEEGTAPLIDDNGLRQDTGTLTLEGSNEKSKLSLQSTSVSGELIEELEKQMQAAVRLTEMPETAPSLRDDGQDCSSSSQEMGTNCTAQPGGS